MDEAFVADGSHHHWHWLITILQELDGDLWCCDALQHREQVRRLECDLEGIAFNGGIDVTDAIATFRVRAHHDHTMIRRVGFEPNPVGFAILVHECTDHFRRGQKFADVDHRAARVRLRNDARDVGIRAVNELRYHFACREDKAHLVALRGDDQFHGFKLSCA